MKFDENILRPALRQSWSLETARQWTAERPFDGQCNVTAVVIFDLFGGEILRTKVPGYTVDHYYNRIDGKVVDLTDEQFSSSFQYDDEVSDRASAAACLRDGEAEILRSSLLNTLK